MTYKKAMPFSYTNRYQQTFYFKKVPTLRGRYRYYTTKKPGPQSIHELPSGFEVYEHPEYGYVFLRKKLRVKIFPEEITIIEENLKEQEQVREYLLDPRENHVIVFTSDMNLKKLREQFPERLAKSKKSPLELLKKCQRFDPQLIFHLEHEPLRVFSVKRRSFVGFSESWLTLEQSEDLAYLAMKYCRYLGTDAYYSLKPL